MKLHLSLIFLFCVGMLHPLEALAGAEDGVAQLVEVELLQDNLAPYKERREDHGAYVGLTYEGLDLQNFVSTLDLKTYGELFGSEPIPLLSLRIDYKYNLSIGSLALGLDFGQGRLSDSISGADRSLEITKYGVALKYTADMIFNEPYVAPYIAVSFWQMGISETSPTDSFSARTQMGMNYTAGVLLQLDWIDFESAKNATFLWGLENTYIDVYATQYAKTSATEDPNTETDLLYGGGLRFEF